MSEEMTSLEAGWTLTLFAERFWGAVADSLVGNDFRLFSLVCTEVRGGITGPRDSSTMAGKGDRRSHARAGHP